MKYLTEEGNSLTTSIFLEMVLWYKFFLYILVKNWEVKYLVFLENGKDIEAIEETVNF